MLDLLRLRFIRLESNSFGIDDIGFNLSYRIELNQQDIIYIENNPLINLDHEPEVRIQSRIRPEIKSRLPRPTSYCKYI